MEPSIFEEILCRINLQGNFTASVLASDDGLPVAAAPTPSLYDANTVAAMVTLVRGFIQDTQQQLGLADVDEVSMVVSDHSRLVCRYFNLEDKRFVLTIVTPPNQSYRRLTTRAIREIAAAWAS